MCGGLYWALSKDEGPGGTCICMGGPGVYVVVVAQYGIQGCECQSETRAPTAAQMDWRDNVEMPPRGVPKDGSFKTHKIHGKKK